MQKLLALLFLFFVTWQSQAQYRSNFDVRSFPDSAQVFINGELMGYTPLRFKQPIHFREFLQYVLEVKKDGYTDYKVTYTKDLKPRFDENINIALKRKRFTTDTVIPTEIEINAVVIDVEEGKPIGMLKEGRKSSPIKWEKSLAEATDEFNKIAEEEMSKSGYTVRKQVKLFAEESQDKEAPLLLGANLKDFKINYELMTRSAGAYTYVTGPGNINCEVEMEWQIFSRKKRAVIFSTVTKGYAMSYGQQDEIASSIRQAVRDALVNLSYNDSMRQVVRAYDKLLPAASASSQNLKTISIPGVKSETFKDYSSMIQKRMGATVTILRDDDGHGSGFLISAQGYLITNFHVIDKAKTITVKFESGIELPAEIITYNEDYDVALLKIKGNGFSSYPVGDSEKAKTASEVSAIGTPADIKLGQSVSKGIISGKREIEGKLYLQTDLSISPGNSGGPLLNSNGDVIGITTWGLRGGGVEGLNFAIPIHIALEKLGVVLLAAPDEKKPVPSPKK